MTTLNLTIPDMACSACVETITEAVQTLDTQASIQADTATKKVSIETSADRVKVQAAIADAGYTIQS